jgi:hypothetical protein
VKWQHVSPVITEFNINSEKTEGEEERGQHNQVHCKWEWMQEVGKTSGKDETDKAETIERAISNLSPESG